MYLKVKKAELVPDTFGQHVKITMVGLYDENGKWLRWVKLNDELMARILTTKIEVK